jgi:hypothetical protein
MPDCVKSPDKPSAIEYTQARGEDGHGIHKRGNRGQIILMPDCIDDYISDSNSARVIEAYINSLDLVELGCTRQQPNATGRPMYDQKDLFAKSGLIPRRKLVCASAVGRLINSPSILLLYHIFFEIGIVGGAMRGLAIRIFLMIY